VAYRQDGGLEATRLGLDLYQVLQGLSSLGLLGGRAADPPDPPQGSGGPRLGSLESRYCGLRSFHVLGSGVAALVVGVAGLEALRSGSPVVVLGEGLARPLLMVPVEEGCGVLAKLLAALGPRSGEAFSASPSSRQ